MTAPRPAPDESRALPYSDEEIAAIRADWAAFPHPGYHPFKDEARWLATIDALRAQRPAPPPSEERERLAGVMLDQPLYEAIRDYANAVLNFNAPLGDGDTTQEDVTRAWNRLCDVANARAATATAPTAPRGEAERLLRDAREAIVFLLQSAPTRGNRLSPEWLSRLVNSLDAHLARPPAAGEGEGSRT